MAEISIWKGGRKIADAPEVQSLFFGLVSDEDFPRIQSAHVHYFSKIDMVPPVLFEHLAGRALMAFLDESEVRFRPDGEATPTLRYIHGRSEVMKGSPSVSAVVLANIKTGDGEPLSLPELVAIQPKLYRRYLQEHGPSLKKT